DGNVVFCSADGLATDAIPAHSQHSAHLFGDVELSELDRAYLAGDHVKAAQSAIRIILRMAKLQGASQLIDVSQVHVDGCIYTGPGSLSANESE
ncbi:aconitase X, partial [Rhizobium johnstonii]